MPLTSGHCAARREARRPNGDLAGRRGDQADDDLLAAGRSLATLGEEVSWYPQVGAEPHREPRREP